MNGSDTFAQRRDSNWRPSAKSHTLITTEQASRSTMWEVKPDNTKGKKLPRCWGGMVGKIQEDR